MCRAVVVYKISYIINILLEYKTEKGNNLLRSCVLWKMSESLSDESDAIRNKAMKCWLGEEDFWWDNFA